MSKLKTAVSMPALYASLVSVTCDPRVEIYQKIFLSCKMYCTCYAAFHTNRHEELPSSLVEGKYFEELVGDTYRVSLKTVATFVS